MKKLPKYREEEIKRFGKAAYKVHRLYVEYRKYLIEELELDEDFVLDNLESIINDDMTAEDLIQSINKELEDR